MSTDDTPNVSPASDPAVPAAAPDTTSTEPRHGKSFGQTVSDVVKRTLLALIGVAILVVLYFVFRSLAPLWWSNRVENFIGKDPGVVKGWTYGIAIGLVCTLVPITCFAMAVASWDRLKHVVGVVFLLVGIAFAIPNVLTLVVFTGDPNSSARMRTAQTNLTNIMGFQTASLVGAIIGGVIGLVIVYFIIKYKLRGRAIEKAERAEKASDK